MRSAEDPLAIQFAALMQAGDVGELLSLICAHPALVTERCGDDDVSRTALHIATDWPGHFANIGETIALLVDAGAPVDGRFAGPHQETPLHWAASSVGGAFNDMRGRALTAATNVWREL